MVIGKKIEDHLSVISTIRPEHARIVISIKKEDFQSCLFDSHSGECLSMTHLPVQDLPPFIASFETKGKDFSEATVFLCHPEVSLIPSSLFQEDDAIEFLRQIHGGDPDHCISHKMEHLSSFLMFSVKDSIRKLVNAHFPQAEIHHISELILLTEEAELKYSGSVHMRAHLEGHALFLYAFDAKKLQFFNSFSVLGPTDTLYYILHSMDSLGMDYATSALSLSGQSPDFKEIEKLLRSYLPLLKAADISEDSSMIDLLSKHQLCVS